MEEALGNRLVDGHREAAEISVADFDGCRWKLVCSPDALNIVTVHFDVPCWRELSILGGKDALARAFGGAAAKPEAGYKVAVKVDCDACEDGAGMVEKLINLRTTLLGAPFERAFSALADGTASKGPVAALPWRDSGEAVYVAAAPDPANTKVYDRVVVVYALDFPDETDRAMARIFLQQLAECKAAPRAPPCAFFEAKAPPLEIRAVASKAHESGVGFLALTVFKRHVDTPEKLAKTVELCAGLRNYLHYHIKASKTNLHMRMRRKVIAWLQIINRAVMTSEKPKEKKLASGRTFFRRG